MFRRILSIFRRVDDVQQQVDELTGMIDGATGTSEQDYCRKAYGLSHQQCLRLGMMILHLQKKLHMTPKIHTLHLKQRVTTL